MAGIQYASWEEAIKEPPLHDVLTGKTKEILKMFEESLGEDSATWKLGVDNTGCPLLGINYSDDDEFLIMHHPQTIGVVSLPRSVNTQP